MGTRRRRRATFITFGRPHLSRLVEEAAKGEEIIIAKAGRPAARLIALEKVAFDREPGRLKHLIEIHRNFDAPLPPEIAGAFGMDQ